MLLEADYAKNYASILYQCLVGINFKKWGFFAVSDSTNHDKDLRVKDHFLNIVILHSHVLSNSCCHKVYPPATCCVEIIFECMPLP